MTFGIYKLISQFLAIEVPTAHALEIPILAPGMLLYDKELYEAFLRDELTSARAGVQFYALHQPSSGNAAIPATFPSLMPFPKIYLSGSKYQPLSFSKGARPVKSDE